MNEQTYTLSQLADYLGAEARGEAHTVVRGIAPLDSAQPEQISFLDNPKFRRYLAGTRASIVLLGAQDVAHCPTAALIVKNPYYAYAKVAELFQVTPNYACGVHATAVLGPGCEIHPSAHVGAYVVMGAGVSVAAHAVIEAGCILGDRVQVGEHTRLYAHVTVYSGVRLGQRVIVHSGAVLGSDGFGIAKHQGHWHKVPQLGGLSVGDDAEIGANTSVDRGALQDTVLEHDVRLDNQVQIGHNVRVGAHTAVAGCVGIAGSTTIGEHCLLGGGVGVAGHLHIADQVAVTGFSGVTKSITQAGVYSGMPAQRDVVWKHNMVRLRQLEKMADKIKLLEQQVAALLAEKV